MSKFDALKNKVAKNYENKGESAKSADKAGAAIAYKIGESKYGKAGMAKKAAAGKEKETKKEDKSEKGEEE